MGEPSLKNEMLHYFSQLSVAEQESLLALVKTIVAERKENFTPVSIEEYNRELEQASAEIEAGDYVTHEEVKKMFLK